MKVDTSQSTLLLRVRNRDKSAVQELYESLFHPCSKVVLTDGGTMNDAREVFQEVIFSLIVKLQKPDFEIKTNLKGYLKQACFNIWVNHKRKQRRLESTDQLMETATDPSGRIEQEEKEKHLIQMNECIKQLSPECQQLLELSFYTKKRDEEIGGIMNYTKLFVRNKRQRCLQGLRNLMGIKK